MATAFSNSVCGTAFYYLKVNDHGIWHQVPDNLGEVLPVNDGMKLKHYRPEKVMEKIVAQIPLARLGKPEEVARVAADASSYITGQVWGVNGGLDM